MWLKQDRDCAKTMTLNAKFGLNKIKLKPVLSITIILLAVFIIAYACCNFVVVRSFKNPIAWTMVSDTIYVLEKQHNTIHQLSCVSPNEPLEEAGSFEIEKDDKTYYYMVRKLFPGRNGVVVQSYIYDQQTEGFVGYRFREYSSFDKPPLEILTIFFKDPKKSYPEVRYAFDNNGYHCFVNDCVGKHAFWKVPPGGGTVIDRDKVSGEILRMGEINKPLSSWTSLIIDGNGRMFVSSGSQDRVVEYSPEGKCVREIGKVGFSNGNLLAPEELTFVSMPDDNLKRLTVASTGNRTWVQFAENGRVVRSITPLRSGYPFPDILVGALFNAGDGSQVCSFDLVNKAFVLFNGDFTVITQYKTKRIQKTCFLIGAAIILLLVLMIYRRWMPPAEKLRFPLFVKLLVLFVPLLIINTLVISYWVKDIMKKDLDQEYVLRSANLARAILNSVSRDDLSAIQQPQDRGSPAYERIHETVSRIVDTANVDWTPKWIIHKIHDGKFYFGINIWRGPIYEPFIVPHDRWMFFKVLEQKKPQEGRFMDEQGQWFSYLAPILDAEGNVIYVIELYRPTEGMDRAYNKVNNHVIKITVLTVFLAVLLALLFSFIFTRPLRSLMRAAKIVSTGDFDHQIVVHSHDETADLAAAFNKMIVNLKQYITDLARTTAERERIRSELSLARDVQQGIIPKIFPPFKGAENIEIFARMDPAREVGGDYYDFFLIDNDHIGVVIADVSGKGVSAGLFMMMVRAILRSAAMNNVNAADAVTKLNTQISVNNPSCFFVTLFFFVCNMRTGKIVLCNAGHNPPVLLGNNKAQSIKNMEREAHGIAIGAMDDAVYHQTEITLREGETLVLYTDGVTESINKDNVMYGEERFIDELNTKTQLSNRRLCNMIVDDVMRFQQGLEQFDDITVLFFKYLGDLSA